ncbi:MAG: hypothetical protein IJV36_06050, partial [Prevotella sp.]|nr:hypothetical protein [Prevotella sp.]
SVNGIPLSGAAFDGKLFAGQDLTLTAEGSGGNGVTGWDVTQVNADGTSITATADGPEITLTVPEGASLSLQAVVETDAIATATVSVQPAPQWHTLDGRRLTARPQRPGLYIHGARKVFVK